MKIMKYLALTLTMVCATSTWAFADSEESNSETAPVSEPDHRLELLLEAPETAQKIDDYVYKLRSEQNFGGTIIVAKEGIMMHRSGSLKDHFEYLHPEALYSTQQPESDSEQPVEIEFVSPIADTSHFVYLNTQPKGCHILSRKDFFHDTVVILIDNESHTNYKDLASDLETLVN